MLKMFIAVLPSLLLLQCATSKNPKPESPGDFRVAFYNVENLFDTVDDPANLGDDEFLPSSKKNWTAERYQQKLNNLAKVVEGMGYPTLIGMAEVENEAVLKDFVEKTSLKARGYGIVHFESPDFRGIDVALLYKKSQFSVADAKPILIKFPVGMIPDKPDYTTRDLLVVKGRLNKKTDLNVIVAHLPSRSEGQKETEPRRQYVAGQIKQQTDAILSAEPRANVVVMGDMNDEPTDPSMSNSLEAYSLGSAVSAGEMYNCFSKLQAEGHGTYRYRGDWNMLDQIILSSNLMEGNKGLKYVNSVIYQSEGMMYKDNKYGPSPNKTFAGDRYFGGYSDHLPVYVDLK